MEVELAIGTEFWIQGAKWKVDVIYRHRSRKGREVHLLDRYTLSLRVRKAYNPVSCSSRDGITMVVLQLSPRLPRDIQMDGQP